jgi:hypothetical protein
MRVVREEFWQLREAVGDDKESKQRLMVMLISRS